MGIKFFQAGLREGWVGEDPPSHRLHGWTVSSATPGALLSVGASPGADRGLTLPALSHPLPHPHPHPLPRLPCAPARRLRPSRAGVAAVPGCPRLPPQAPWPPSSLGAPRGERGTAREAEAGALGTSALPTCWRPRLREPKRRERQGPGGRRRGGRRSSATPVTSGAARPPFLPFPLCFLPPLPSARAKWPWRRHARAGVSRAGENGVHPGRAEAGGQVRGVGGEAVPPSTESARKGGLAAALPQTCLGEKGARAQQPVRPRRRGWVPPHPLMQGPLRTLHARLHLLGKEGGVVRQTFLPTHPSPSFGTPPQGGAEASGPGRPSHPARQLLLPW